jgi:hypothetical protein
LRPSPATASASSPIATCGEHIDVIVESKQIIDLARCSDAEVEEWSHIEGWSPAAGREFGRRYGAGLQIRFRKAED